MKFENNEKYYPTLIVFGLLYGPFWARYILMYIVFAFFFFALGFYIVGSVERVFSY